MRRFSIYSALAVVCMTSAAEAEDASRLRLPDLFARARRSPRIEAARQARGAAGARLDEVSRAWLPRLTITAAGGPTSEVTCLPSADECVTTEPADLRAGLDGAFFRLDAEIVAPLFSFGKYGAGKRAAVRGHEAAAAIAEASETDVLLEAARAYYGVKLARELAAMLDEGEEHVSDELERIGQGLARQSGSATLSDRHRMEVVRSEIAARRAEVGRMERVALAGVRLHAGDPAADVNAGPLGPLAEGRGQLRATAIRPEERAAAAGAGAAEALGDLAAAQLWPDLVLVGRAAYARAEEVNDPKNAFAYDPVHARVATVLLALRWSLDLGGHGPRVRGARAEAGRARATAETIRQGLVFETRRAEAELDDARERLRACDEGQKAARAWLVSAAQAADLGLGEPRDIAEALTAYFTSRARYLQAAFDWNIAVLSLVRARGGDIAAFVGS